MNKGLTWDTNRLDWVVCVYVKVDKLSPLIVMLLYKNLFYKPFATRIIIEFGKYNFVYPYSRSSLETILFSQIGFSDVSLPYLRKRQLRQSDPRLENRMVSSGGE